MEADGHTVSRPALKDTNGFHFQSIFTTGVVAYEITMILPSNHLKSPTENC